MTIMVESSRTFLFTEYARNICGVMHNQGTDPKVWDNLPVRLLLSCQFSDFFCLSFFHLPFQLPLVCFTSVGSLIKGKTP
jgi:hypothetical protein